jgi:hypothetical protein
MTPTRFRWANCQLESLSKYLNKRQLKASLRSLPKTLDETYERILTSIDEEYEEYALRILRWLTFAREPPTLEAVAEIVAIDATHELAFDVEEVLDDAEDALTVCGSLVTVLKGSDTDTYEEWRGRDRPSRYETRLVLSHFSVKEYLVSNRICDGPVRRYHLSERESHESIARACILYLRLPAPKSWRPRSDADQLYDYTKRWWAMHARSSEPFAADTMNLLFRFFTEDCIGWLERRPRNWNAALYPWFKSDDLRGDPALEALFSASLAGLNTMVRHILQPHPELIDAVSRTGENALVLAAHARRVTTMQLLLDLDAKLRLTKSVSGDPLVFAARCSSTQAIRFLIQLGATDYLIEAMKAACKHGPGHIVRDVKILFEAEARSPVVSKSPGGTILHQVVSDGCIRPSRRHTFHVAHSGLWTSFFPVGRANTSTL